MPDSLDPSDSSFNLGEVAHITLDVLDGQPIQNLNQLLALISGTRKKFSGRIIVFDKDTINHPARLVRQKCLNDPYQLGWHIHQGYDTVQISNNSPVPTVVAQTVIAAANGILKMLNCVSPQLKNDNRSISLEWGSERGIFYVEGPLNKQVAAIQQKLHRICEGQEKNPDIIQETFDHCRHLLGRFGEISVMMYRLAQEFTPSDQIITLSPQKHGVYVIPENVVHARSLRNEGPAFRRENQMNWAFAFDPHTQQILDPQRVLANAALNTVHRPFK